MANNSGKENAMIIIVLSIIVAISVILNIVLGASTVFLGRELLKKFYFWTQFYNSAKNILTVSEFKHLGTVTPGMGTFSQSIPDNKPFGALISFDISPFIPKIVLRLLGLKDLIGKTLYDPFGFEQSKAPEGTEYQQIKFQVFFGKGPAGFVMLTTIQNPALLEREPSTKDGTVYKAHWFQR